MKYLQVKPHRGSIPLKNTYYIADELFTLKEAKKLGVKKEYCKEIETSSRNTHKCFGVRFLNE